MHDYKNEPTKTMENFIYTLALKFPQKIREGMVEVEKIVYYVFERVCNGGEIECSVLKKCQLNTLVMLMLPDGVEV